MSSNLSPHRGYHRRAKFSLHLGGLLTVGGFAALTLSIYLIRGTIDWQRAMGSLAMLAIIVGVVMGGVAFLALRGRSIEEAYTLGFDLGYEKGVRSGQRDLLALCPYPEATCHLKRVDIDADSESVSSALEAESRKASAKVPPKQRGPQD